MKADIDVFLGLYIAMILDYLDIKGLSYEILEASDRVGGRVYTHYFSEKKHDYYDVSPPSPSVSSVN